jgi:Uma2 family endonuclease
MRHARIPASGPFRASGLSEGSRYELSGGHAIYCAPAGGSHAAATVRVSRVIGSDPMAVESGADAGFQSNDLTLRAPDFAVGGVKDTVRGWLQGTPALAVEIASVGQDEEDLQAKILDLLAAGTRWVWVVRLVGPRRVEVYAPGEPMQLRSSGDELLAPGVLANPVPVDALFDTEQALDAETRHVLQQHGFDGIDAVMAAGAESGKRDSLARVLVARFGPLSPAEQARVDALPAAAIDDAILRAITASTLADVL